MKFSKTLVILLCSLAFVACADKHENASNETVGNHQQTTEGEEIKYANYLDDIDISDIEIVSMQAEYVIDISNIEELINAYDHVFIGTVDSIDGCSTTIGTNSFNFIPKTYGTLSVLDDLKGNMNQDKIQFARTGGIISIADYEKNAPKEMLVNDEKHRLDANQESLDKESTYHKYLLDGDIDLEAGKTYLFFGTFYESGVFSIYGAQYGAREVRQKDTNITTFRSLPEVNSLEIKNNDTGEYETLDSIIDQYFK